MATAVRVTRGLTANTAFGNNLRDQINKAIELSAQQVKIEAERRVKAIVAAEFNNGRTVTQRKGSGNKLINSFSADVRMESGPYPVVITLRSSAKAVKVNALNNGSAPHLVPGIPKASKPIGFVTKGGDSLVRYGPFNHPGTKASWFMQRAIEQAVAAVYHKTIRIPRR